MERKSFRTPEFSDSSSDEDDEGDTRSGAENTPPKKAEPAGAERLAEAPKALWRRVTQELIASDEEPEKAEEESPAETTEAIAAEFAANLDEAGDEVPLGHLSTAEQHEAAKAYLEMRQQEVAEELEALNPETVEAQAATVAEHLLEAAQEELDANPTADVDESADQAYLKTVRAELPETPEAVAARALAIAGTTEMPTLQAGDESADKLPKQFTHYLEDDEQDIRFPAPETHDSERDNEDGPRTPRPYGLPQSDGVVSFTHSRSPNNAGNEAARRRDKERAERQAATRGFLAGAIVGGLIMRRRTRIKTEKRLLSVQKKLEAEVRTAHTHIAEKEVQIRQLVHDQAELSKAEVMSRVKQTLRAESAPPPATLPETPARKAEKPTEHLGLTTLKAVEARPAESARPQPAPSAEALNVKELVDIGEHITVGATNLRKVYETNLISERGLRRVVGEYRRGGDVRRALAEEMLIKELSYERDPMLRDTQLATEQTAGGGRQTTTPAGGLNQIAAPPTNQPIPPSPTLPTTSRRQPKQSTTPPILVAANTTALVILAVLIIILFVVWVQKLL